MNRLLVTRVATVPVSLDVVVAGIRQMGAVQQVEHEEMVLSCAKAHIGRMVSLLRRDPLSA
jgi:hypothetical protein